MDTITHALAGALAGRGTAGRTRTEGLTPAKAAWATLAASVFPDIDFVIALFDSMAYLSYHRLFTHTVVLLPIWAMMLALLAGWLDPRRGWRPYLPWMVLGIALHILLDAFNIWPLKPLWPLLDWEMAWPVLFVIDPIYTAIIVIGLALSMWWRRRVMALVTIVVLALYTAVQFPLNHMATRHTAVIGEAQAFAQPLSPLHRRVVVLGEDGPSWAFIRQFSDRPSRWGYAPADQAEWHSALYPWSAGELAGSAWNRPEMSGYRNFATLPYVYGVAAQGGSVCVWFADLRFTMPGVDPAFRWGMCRNPDGLWSRHRRGRW